jgi:hypothetical protein
MGYVKTLLSHQETFMIRTLIASVLLLALPGPPSGLGDPMNRRGGLRAGGAAARTDQASDAFFNGKDFDGWEGLMEYWSVRDGAIVGKAPAEGLKFHTFLCSKKKYKDFELSFQVRITDGKGNSGVQVRSRLADPAKYAVAGPQGDIGRPFWGGLYGELDPGHWMKLPPQKVVREVLKPADFNDFSIKCLGKHVTIQLNGATTVNDNFPEMPDEGIIAWQLHADYPGMEAIVRNIQFKDLSQ